MPETLARFGHHADPAMDFCIEVEAIQSIAYDAGAGRIERGDLEERIARAMQFRAGGDADALRAKALLRKIEAAECGGRSTPPTAGDLPPGEYAIVELFGHTTMVGRVSEVERFGAKMMAMEPIFQDALLPAVFHGGSAIYRMTPCTAEVAFKRQPKEAWQLPLPIRCTLAPALLPSPSAIDATDLEREEDARELPF